MAKKKKPNEAANIFEAIIKASVKENKVIKTYSQKEADEIRLILSKIRIASRDEQKKLRDYLRENLNFYISDYTSSKEGFTVEDFDNLIRQRKIKIG
jgi:hypothetical protein